MRVLRAIVTFLLLGLPFRASAEEILVFAAASLTESIQEVGQAYREKTGTILRYSFGASSDLARQIKAGAPADVFFSADTARMDEVTQAGLVEPGTRRDVLSNQLVVIVPEGSKTTVAGPDDLLHFSKL